MRGVFCYTVLCCFALHCACTSTATSLHCQCTVTASSLHRHCTVTAPSLYCHYTGMRHAILSASPMGLVPSVVLASPIPSDSDSESAAGCGQLRGLNPSSSASDAVPLLLQRKAQEVTLALSEARARTHMHVRSHAHACTLAHTCTCTDGGTSQRASYPAARCLHFDFTALCCQG